MCLMVGCWTDVVTWESSSVGSGLVVMVFLTLDGVGFYVC